MVFGPLGMFIFLKKTLSFPFCLRKLKPPKKEEQPGSAHDPKAPGVGCLCVFFIF